MAMYRPAGLSSDSDPDDTWNLDAQEYVPVSGYGYQVPVESQHTSNGSEQFTQPQKTTFENHSSAPRQCSPLEQQCNPNKYVNSSKVTDQCDLQSFHQPGNIYDCQLEEQPAIDVHGPTLTQEQYPLGNPISTQSKESNGNIAFTQPQTTSGEFKLPRLPGVPLRNSVSAQYQYPVKKQESVQNKFLPSVNLTPTVCQPALNCNVKKNPTFSEAKLLEDFRLAAMRGKLNAVKDILSTGIEVDAVLKCTMTALMYSCSHCHLDVIEYLIENGADPNFAPKNMFTPLMAVCASKHEDEETLIGCVKFLVMKGANIEAGEKGGVTAMMFAAKNDRKEVVLTLLELGADINQQDNRGWTALAWAAHSGLANLVSKLLEANADPGVPCLNGQSAADIARERGHDPEFSKPASGHFSSTSNGFEKATGDERLSTSKESLNSAWMTGTGSKLNILVQEVGSSTSAGTSVNQKKKWMPNDMVLSDTDFEMMLVGLNLEFLIPLFQTHNVDFSLFLRLTDEDLLKMGIESVGVRKRLLEGIRDVHLKPWSKHSLPENTIRSHISAPEAQNVILNIAKHISYIDSTMTFLIRELEQRSHELQIGQEVVSVKEIMNETESVLNLLPNIQKTFEQMRSTLHKLGQKVEHTPADLINGRERKRTGEKMCRRIPMKRTAAFVAVASLIAFLCLRGK